MSVQAQTTAYLLTLVSGTIYVTLFDQLEQGMYIDNINLAPSFSFVSYEDGREPMTLVRASRPLSLQIC